MNVDFGLLTKIKASKLQGNNKLQGLQQEFKNQLSIFDQAKKSQDAGATEATQGGAMQPAAFASPSMSAGDLEKATQQAEDKLLALQNSIQGELKNSKPENNGGEDKKEPKIESANFGKMA